MKVPVPFCVSILVLLDTVAVFLCRAEFALTTDDQDVVMEMCQAQYTAWCSHQDGNCTTASLERDKLNGVTWLSRCTQTDVNQTDAECEGTCSNLANETGEVPERPVVSVRRVPLTHVVEISWRADPNISSEVVYIIASSQPNTTDTPDMIQFSEVANLTYQIAVSDVCWTPEIRVAAVSPYGSRWFSDVVNIPDLIPGPPQDINLTSLNYNPAISSDFIYYTLEWLPPDGWSYLDLNMEHNFDYTTECVKRSFFDALYVFVDTFKLFHVQSPSISDVQGAFGVTGRIPVDAVDCNITFHIQAVSRCSSGAVGETGEYKLDLSCDKVPMYTDKNCGTSQEVIVPGPVSDVRFVIVPDADGLVGLVSWRPPDSLGSFSRVDIYHVFWGIMDLMNSDPITQLASVLGHVTVPGTTLETDLDLNVTWSHPQETVGVMISAAGEGQVIDMPFSDIYLPENGITSATIPGEVIADDDTIIVVTTETDQESGADVFWRRTKVGDEDNLAISYDVQWGLSCGGNNTDRISCFTPFNTTRVEQAYISLHGLLANTTYGIEIVSVFNVSIDVCDEYDDIWNDTELHTFTMPQSQGTREVMFTPSMPPYTPPTTTPQPVAELNRLHVIAVVITGILVPVGAILVYVRMRRRHQRLGMVGVVSMTDTEYRDYTVFLPGTSVDAIRTAHCPIVADEWELPLSCVKFGHVLGSGAFGKVVKGQVTRAMLTHRGVAPLLGDGGVWFDDVSKLHVTVAIKMLQEDCDSRYKQDFLKEIQLMKSLGHHRNVVSMLGCCTLRDPICLVVEHAEFGDLLNYLKNVRQKVIDMTSVDGHYVNTHTDLLSSKDLVSFACQVALGMDFLASKGFVHRDLAARNVLMCANRTCKIGDFGLARYIYDNIVYVNRRGGRLPVKWMSVEAIFDMSFSTASDVWSFGILLYEIVTLGGTPYPTIPTRDLLRELQGGYRMEKPENCSNHLYEMMIQCWQTNPHDRPTFSLLSQWLQAMTEDTSETDHLDMKLGFDRHLYKADEDAVSSVEAELALTSDQDSVTTSDTSEYPRTATILFQDPTLVCHTSLSEDSGYCSPQKESVSSGGSTMTLPSGSIPRDTRSLSEAMPRSELSTNFPGAFSETVIDDVFHEDGVVVEDERNASLWTECENDYSTASNHTPGIRPQRRRRRQLEKECTNNPEAIRENPEDRGKRSVHQSLTDLSDKALSRQSANYNNHIRRKSDSDIIISVRNVRLRSGLPMEMIHHHTTPTIDIIHHKKTPTIDIIHHKKTPTIEMIHHKKTSTNEMIRHTSSPKSTDMPTKTKNMAANKQRRKAVVVPPTLALDNELYHRAEILRQNPPIICISRRTQRNKASEFISAETWTGDGEFNFRRTGARELKAERNACPSVTSALEASTLHTDKLLDSNTRNNAYIIPVEIHRDCSMDQEGQVKTDSNLESLALSGSETRQEEVPFLPDHTHLSPRVNRTFVRSHCRSISKDTPYRKSAGKQATHEQTHRSIHGYADYKHVIGQSSNPSELSNMGREEPSPRTAASCELGSLLFDLKAMTEPSSRFNHGQLKRSHQDRNILHGNASGSENCQKQFASIADLDSLSQTVRRTYSSPKEQTLAEKGFGKEEDHRELMSLMLRRRQSDPFIVNDAKFSRHFAKLLISDLSLKPQSTQADSPGQQSTCFQWPHARRRKDTPANRPTCELDSCTKKSFPHEKHPAVLHQVSNPGNVGWN